MAHCMGLGKTLQTIGLIHTVMTSCPDEIPRTLVLCPVNTIKNWEDEFNKWLRGPLADDLEVYEMTGDKNNKDRSTRIKMWHREGSTAANGDHLG